MQDQRDYELALRLAAVSIHELPGFHYQKTLNSGSSSLKEKLRKHGNNELLYFSLIHA